MEIWINKTENVNRQSNICTKSKWNWQPKPQTRLAFNQYLHKTNCWGPSPAWKITPRMASFSLDSEELYEHWIELTSLQSNNSVKPSSLWLQLKSKINQLPALAKQHRDIWPCRITGDLEGRMPDLIALTESIVLSLDQNERPQHMELSQRIQHISTAAFQQNNLLKNHSDVRPFSVSSTTCCTACSNIEALVDWLGSTGSDSHSFCLQCEIYFRFLGQPHLRKSRMLQDTSYENAWSQNINSQLHFKPNLNAIQCA